MAKNSKQTSGVLAFLSYENKYVRVIWRFLRVFLATFVVIGTTNLEGSLTDILSGSISPQTFYFMFVVPTLAGSLSAAFKALREYAGEYLELVKRMPF